MLKKNDSVNSMNSTKRPPFVTRLRISWICRLVLMLAAVKIVFLASLVLTNTENAAPTISPAIPLEAGGRPTAERKLDPTAKPSSAMPAVSESARLAEKETRILETTPVGDPQAKQKSAGKATVARTSAGDPQAALAYASSNAALSVPHLVGSSVAYAADMPPVQPVMPPPPNVRPMDSPITPERVVRPDEAMPPAAPAPEVAPFISRDSAPQKQAELNRREQELLALQQQMESRMAELHSLENRIQGMLQDANTTQDSKFKQLVDMYANMKPRQAAQALTSVDETIAVKILTGMKSKQSGEILSYMDPKHAARLSEVMSKMQL